MSFWVGTKMRCIWILKDPGASQESKTKQCGGINAKGCGMNEPPPQPGAAFPPPCPPPISEKHRGLHRAIWTQVTT